MFVCFISNSSSLLLYFVYWPCILQLCSAWLLVPGVFLLSHWNFLYRQSCHLWINMVLFLLFQSVHLLFLFHNLFPQEWFSKFWKRIHNFFVSLIFSSTFHHYLSNSSLSLRHRWFFQLVDWLELGFFFFPLLVFSGKS